MSELKVHDSTVPGVIENLRKGEWLVPQFQRDFVWSTDQVSSLVQSILEARPIGMVTLWEQSDESQLDLERLSIPDDPTHLYYGPDVKASRRFALLDGRQRCTAIAMAFGGFRATHGLYRYSGRYFLDVKQSDPRKRVKYLRESDIRRQGLESDANCVGKGLFPLASNIPDEPLLSQWMRYLQALERSENYPNHEVPPKDEVHRRNKILQDAFEGIVKTKLAVYIVPEKYSLADICDIFETLNTTGTKVSTVDLIHSWLYAETHNDQEGPFLLREWFDDLGQKDGAIGWISSNDRPELTAQIITACHVALINKPEPRAVGSGRAEAITSVKSGDLLATPTAHWKSVRENGAVFTTFLGEAQKVIANGYFPWSACPYPVAIAIYVALRWHREFDREETHPWSIEDLNALFRAFFWRNSLTRRYDQGFLTQIGTDIQYLKAILNTRPNRISSAEWAGSATTQLNELFEYPLPDKTELISNLCSGNQGGAFQKALSLPMLAGARKDLVSSVDLSFPTTEPIELHHIYPKNWCKNNKSGALASLLDSAISGQDYVNSTANLMPLSRKSNNIWRDASPAVFIEQKRLSFAPLQETLNPIFIDEQCFQFLASGTASLKEFWERRASLISDDLLKKTAVTF